MYIPTNLDMRCHVDVSVKRGYDTCIFKLFYFTVVGLNNLIEHAFVTLWFIIFAFHVQINDFEQRSTTFT